MDVMQPEATHIKFNAVIYIFGSMWVTEVEFTHHVRLLEVLQSRNTKCAVKIGNLKGEATLILSDINITQPGVLPVECYKYIYKTFNAPYCCRDPSWFIHHGVVKELIKNGAKIRIQCIPKVMGSHVAEALIGEDDEGGFSPENISFTNNTHIFHCFYSMQHACFYWGVGNVEDPTTQNTSWVSLHQAVVNSNNEKNLVPICRAYYKMQEIIEHFFPLWTWKPPTGAFQAVDIGASPGGWTQYIALCMKSAKVLAVDPGVINAELVHAANGKVVHCQALAEAAETRDTLAAYGGFALCVCDINVEPWGTIELLVDHVLPYANIITALEQSDNEKNSFGYLVVTLKLLKNPKEKHIQKAVETAIDILSNPMKRNGDADGRSTYGVKGWDFKVVHLNANSRNERTIVCKFCNVLIHV